MPLIKLRPTVFKDLARSKILLPHCNSFFYGTEKRKTKMRNTDDNDVRLLNQPLTVFLYF